MLTSNKKINMMDFAATIDLLNSLMRLGLCNFKYNKLDDLQAQLDIIRYRSQQV